MAAVQAEIENVFIVGGGGECGCLLIIIVCTAERGLSLNTEEDALTCISTAKQNRLSRAAFIRLGLSYNSSNFCSLTMFHHRRHH